jgi:hypothetical protein
MAEKKIVLTLEASKFDTGKFYIKKITNSVEWSIDQVLSKQEVKNLIDTREDVLITIVGPK